MPHPARSYTSRQLANVLRAFTLLDCYRPDMFEVAAGVLRARLAAQAAQAQAAGLLTGSAELQVGTGRGEEGGKRRMGMVCGYGWLDAGQGYGVRELTGMASGACFGASLKPVVMQHGANLLFCSLKKPCAPLLRPPPLPQVPLPLLFTPQNYADIAWSVALAGHAPQVCMHVCVRVCEWMEGVRAWVRAARACGASEQAGQGRDRSFACWTPFTGAGADANPSRQVGGRGPHVGMDCGCVL